MMSTEIATRSAGRLDSVTPYVSLLAVLAIMALVAFTAGTLKFQPAFNHDTTKNGDVAYGPTMVFNDAEKHAREERAKEIKLRFEQAVAMLHAKKYEFALPPLHRLMQLDPKMPEAYVNMGFALIGLKRYKVAEEFFQTAIDLRPYQDNAYWGLAVSLENQNDLDGALGAMRTYIHLAPPNDPYVTRARSALWEWEYRLDRGPLPKNEAEWLKRRGHQWDYRDSPKRDMPDQGPKTIPISVSPID
jgi:tetratricopeptide (TPR) repeat protein